MLVFTRQPWHRILALQPLFRALLRLCRWIIFPIINDRDGDRRLFQLACSPFVSGHRYNVSLSYRIQRGQRDAASVLLAPSPSGLGVTWMSCLAL